MESLWIQHVNGQIDPAFVLSYPILHYDDYRVVGLPTRWRSRGLRKKPAGSTLPQMLQMHRSIQVSKTSRASRGSTNARLSTAKGVAVRDAKHPHRCRVVVCMWVPGHQPIAHSLSNICLVKLLHHELSEWRAVGMAWNGGQWEQASELFDRMLWEGVQRNTIAYTGNFSLVFPGPLLLRPWYLFPGPPWPFL